MGQISWTLDVLVSLSSLSQNHVPPPISSELSPSVRHAEHKYALELAYGRAGACAAQLSVALIGWCLSCVLVKAVYRERLGGVLLWLLGTFVLLAVSTVLLVYVNGLRVRAHEVSHPAPDV